MINLSFSDVFDLINRFLQRFICTVNFSLLTSGLSLFSISLISVVLFILMFFMCGVVYTFYRCRHFCIYAYAYRRCAISEKGSPLVDFLESPSKSRKFLAELGCFYNLSLLTHTRRESRLLALLDTRCVSLGSRRGSGRNR